MRRAFVVAPPRFVGGRSAALARDRRRDLADDADRLRGTGRNGETVGVNFDAIAAHPLAGLLALAGGAALLFRSARALLRLGLAAAEGATIDGLVEVSRRNGNLTGMAERQD